MGQDGESALKKTAHYIAHVAVKKCVVFGGLTQKGRKQIQISEFEAPPEAGLRAEGERFSAVGGSVEFAPYDGLADH